VTVIYLASSPIFKPQEDDRVKEVLEKYSADALRFWAAGSKLGEDLDYQEKDLIAGKKFITKLWNASQFVFMNLKDFNGKKPKRLEKVEYSREDEELVGRIPIQRPYICISPGGSGSKVLVAWPEERFIELIRRLKGCSIVLTGDKNDKELCERIARDTPAISLAGNLTLKQLSCLYEGAACVVSNDSGPMHISAAMNAPTVGLFGPDTPIRYAPFGKGNISLYKKMHCSPCRKAYLASWNECKAQYCMQKILVGEVEQAVKNAVSAQPLRQLS